VYFKFDSRLGIELPDFPTTFEELPHPDQEAVLLRWETIRAAIPDQIFRFERAIEDCLEIVHHEEDWDEIALQFDHIADYASRIHDLNMWRRVDPSLPHPPEHSVSQEHRDREK